MAQEYISKNWVPGTWLGISRLEIEQRIIGFKNPDKDITAWNILVYNQNYKKQNITALPPFHSKYYNFYRLQKPYFFSIVENILLLPPSHTPINIHPSAYCILQKTTITFKIIPFCFERFSKTFSIFRFGSQHSYVLQGLHVPLDELHLQGDR